MIITYGLYSKPQSITIPGIGYHFSALHICYSRQNKVLAFDDVGVLSLSLDNGLTYPITLNLTGVCSIIKRAKIYANGNIMWANNTTCYYSTDNLATYHTSNVLDINGSSFTPATYDNFKNVFYTPELIINGVQMDVWGAYSIEGGTAYVNMNVWYTIDSGVTIKSCFLVGTTIVEGNNFSGGQRFRHVHSFDYCDIDGSFWMRTGDGQGYSDNYDQLDNQYINQAFYNWGTDTWTFKRMASCGPGYLGGGSSVIYVNGYAFWTSEVYGANGGIWKTLYSEFLKLASDYSHTVDNMPSNTQIATTSGGDGALGIYKDGNTLICFEYRNKVVHISTDAGVTWVAYTLTGGPNLGGSLGAYLNCCGPDNNGYFRFDIMTDTKNYRDFTSGTVLMLRVK